MSGTVSTQQANAAKGMKISRTSWLILSAGIFVVILAGLGLTRVQQLRDQSQMNEQISLSQAQLDKINVTDLRRQLDDVQQKVDDGKSQLTEATQSLRQTVVSVDVTNELFKIASFSGVKVMNLSTSTVAENKLADISLKTIALSTQAEGDLDKLVDFVINLNHGFATGYVQTADITVPAAPSGGVEGGGGEQAQPPPTDKPTVSVQMIVYSYEGN